MRLRGHESRADDGASKAVKETTTTTTSNTTTTSSTETTTTVKEFPREPGQPTSPPAPGPQQRPAVSPERDRDDTAYTQLWRPDPSRGKLQDGALVSDRTASSLEASVPTSEPYAPTPSTWYLNRSKHARPPAPPATFSPPPIPDKFTQFRYFPSTFPTDESLTRDLMRPPKYGGHSKREQLGSIAESWGPDPEDPLRKGLFQHLEEPPSPTLNPL